MKKLSLLPSQRRQKLIEAANEEKKITLNKKHIIQKGFLKHHHEDYKKE